MYSYALKTRLATSSHTPNEEVPSKALAVTRLPRRAHLKKRIVETKPTIFPQWFELPADAKFYIFRWFTPREYANTLARVSKEFHYLATHSDEKTYSLIIKGQKALHDHKDEVLKPISNSCFLYKDIAALLHKPITLLAIGEDLVKIEDLKDFTMPSKKANLEKLLSTQGLHAIQSNGLQSNIS